MSGLDNSLRIFVFREDAWFVDPDVDAIQFRVGRACCLWCGHCWGIDTR